MLYSLICIIFFLKSASSQSQPPACTGNGDPTSCMNSFVGDWCFAIYEPGKKTPVYGQVILTMGDFFPPITSTVGTQSVVGKYLIISGDNPPPVGYPNITLVDVTLTDKVTYIIANPPADDPYASFILFARLPGKMRFLSSDSFEAVFANESQFDGYVLTGGNMWIEGPGGFQIPVPYPVAPAEYQYGHPNGYYYVKGERGPCPTPSPTPFPSPSPTSPTPSPSPSPTFTGQTYSPTMSPTSQSPTRSPTMTPTPSPTPAPTSPPPTMSPTTMSPTESPTYADSSNKILPISAIIGVVMFGSIFSFSF